MICSFLINTVQSLHSYTKSAASFDMYSQQFTYLCLVKSLNSSSYCFLRFVYVSNYQLCHPLVVYPFLRKILDPPPADPHLDKIFPFSTLFKTRDQSYWFNSHTELCTAVELPSSSNLLLLGALYEVARNQSSKIISAKEFYIKSLFIGHLREFSYCCHLH